MKLKLIIICVSSFFVWSISCTEIPQSQLLANKIHETSPKKNRKATISFVFHNEELVDIINMLAAKKRVNIILPTGANAINAKVTLTIPHKLTLEEAWNLLPTLLDLAGYSLVPQPDLYIVVKNGKDITRETFPIYINTPIEDIPNTDERIRYIYYLKNIKAEFDTQIDAVFKAFMPDDAILKSESSSNGLLMVAKAQDVRSFIQVLEALDEVGFQETLEIIRLRYTQATNVAKIFTEILKIALPHPTMRFNADARKDQAASYFSSNMRVFPEPRTNSLVVLGRVQAVERIKDFIFKHIDVELDSGKSILHIYELQYLDASSFADVLSRIVDSSSSGGTEQSKAGGPQGGIEHLFDKVIIRADSSEEASEESSEGKYFGGNKLVVAARNDDWKKIKILIEQLDQPQPQVIIEVLLADLTLDDARSLGSITRNQGDQSFPGNASMQAAMIDQVVLDAQSENQDAINQLTGVASDLNAITVPVFASDGSITDYVSVPNDQTAGSTVISFSDKNGRTWSILEILQQFNSTKILSHPHIIAINNQKATIEVGETRLLTDQAAPSTSGITINKKKITANTNVYITPRISAANTVNLTVEIKIDQFLDPTNLTSGNRVNRQVLTNATVKSGDILALGGLVREDTADTLNRTPILSDIPILGWFFKRKDKTIGQTSLSIFISPTIIQPKLRGGVGKYTKAYVEIAQNYTRQGGLFDNLRDPITRWFFKSGAESALITSDFLNKDDSIDTSRKTHVIDLISDSNMTLADQQLALEAPDTTTPLKTFLVKEENPLKDKNVVQEIEGAPRIKEHKNGEVKNKRSSSENKNNSTCAQAQTKKIEPKPSAKNNVAKVESKVEPTIESNEESLKNLLEDLENPLIRI